MIKAIALDRTPPLNLWSQAKLIAFLPPDDCRNIMIVIARKYGQLGNRLFLFAHLLAAAKQYGVELRNPCFAEYAHLFPTTRSDWWCRYPVQVDGVASAVGSNGRGRAGKPRSTLFRKALMKAVEVAAKSGNGFAGGRTRVQVMQLRRDEYCDLQGDRFRAAIDSGKILLLQGWEFRSEELLESHRDHVRDFFRISDPDQMAVDASVHPARSECDVLVGVHIRRGDYRQFRGGRFFYTDQQYARWMHQVQEQYPNQRVGFLVCSHEALDQKAFRGLTIIRGPGTALQDMYALAETDWIMGPPSTFTAWSAYIGGNDRIQLESRESKVLAPRSTDRVDSTDRLAAA